MGERMTDVDQRFHETGLGMLQPVVAVSSFSKRRAPSASYAQRRTD